MCFLSAVFCVRPHPRSYTKRQQEVAVQASFQRQTTSAVHQVRASVCAKTNWCSSGVERPADVSKGIAQPTRTRGYDLPALCRSCSSGRCRVLSCGFVSGLISVNLTESVKRIKASL